MVITQDFMLFFLISIRVVAVIISSPIFSTRQIPSLVKVGLSLIIGFLIAPTITASVDIPDHSILMVLLFAKEVIIGICIGFISTMIFNVVRVSAQLMDFGIGFSMAQYYDPATSGNSTPLERFFNWFALILFLTFNLHHVIISAVIRSFDLIPLGPVAIGDNIFVVLVNIFSKSFYLAIQLAAPIIIILLVTDFTLGLIARTVPQLNVFMLGMPIKTLVGLFAIMTILPGLVRVYIKVFETLPDNIMDFFKVFPLILLADFGEKTEEATQKKLQDARKKGQVPKSTDLNSAVVLAGVTLLMGLMGNFIYSHGKNFIIQSFKLIRPEDFSYGDASGLLLFMLKNGLMVAAPISILVLILGVASNIAQIGFLASSEGLKPKLEKLNPIEGFKKLFSKRSLVELFKSIFKIGLIGLVVYSFIKSKITEILITSDLNPVGIYPYVNSLMSSQLVRVIMVMAVLGAGDYIFQKWQFKKDMRMSKQEVKEEYKQMEGDQHIKSKIKQKQREMATRRMMHEVPNATVVITNPTHFAVALQYDKQRSSAPIVCAKGTDLIALRIKDIAKQHSVPIIENKPLARALYSGAEIDQQIPAELYQAVAEIMAYVMSLKK